jgi:hypothetical protein
MNTNTEWELYYGKKIAAAKLTDDSLVIKFTDGITIQLTIDGQSFLGGDHYMTCDDDLMSLIGETLTSVEEREVYDDTHFNDVVFVKINTSGGTVTIATHNDHNGYYGDFCLNISEIDSIVEV